MSPDTDLFGRPNAASVARRWVPTIYVDEVTPEARATPSDWLITLSDGRRALCAFSPDCETSTPAPLSHTDCVEFRWLETYPNIELEIQQDGSWSTSAPPHPNTGMVSVWGGYEFMADTLDQLVQQLKDVLHLRGITSSYTISCYRWSDSLPFFFDEKTGNFRTGVAESPADGGGNA